MPGPQPCPCIPFIFCIVGRGLDPSGGVGDAAPYILGRELSANRRGGLPPSLAPLVRRFPAFIAFFTILRRRLYISLSYSYCTLVQYLSSCPISFQPSHFLPLSPPIRVRAKRAPPQLSAHLPPTPTKKGALAPDQICYRPSSSKV